MTKPLSALEQVKATVDPYAGREVFARLAQGTVEDITPEDDLVMRWHGLYRHRPQEAGFFMLRLKLPGGALTAAQVLAAADVAERYSRGAVNLTTRQDLEFHQLTLAVLPPVFDALDAAGLTTLGACGDQVRNVVTCPVAGLDPRERWDTSAEAQAITAAFLANPAFANLPRKFKVALCGCAQHCVPVETNDLSFVAASNAVGDPGYAVLVGGGLSAQPVRAAELNAWVAPAEVVELVSRAVEIFREHGNREQRGHARLKHLLADRGLAWFRAELAARLGRPLTPLAQPLPTASRRDHLGVHPQRDGLVYIGLPVPAARVSVAQLRVLAELADTLGQGRLRITHQQNIVLPDLPAAQVDTVLATLAAHGLPVEVESWRGRFVVCTGKEFCNKAAAHTKEVALRLLPELDATLPGVPLSLHMSGCPNNCGQHALGDIGLQGAVSRVGETQEERFDVWVGGGEGNTPTFAKRLLARVPPAELAETIRQLWARYQAEADAGETFSDYARRVLWATAATGSTAG